MPKCPPSDWPRISTSLFYDDAAAAIDWLCRAFGFAVRIKVDGEGGDVAHSELTLGDGVIMVGSAKKDPHRVSPRSVGGRNTQGIFVYVEDVAAHCARARAAGATISDEPREADYGPDYWTDRCYGAVDPEGHRWWFAQRLRDPPK